MLFKLSICVCNISSLSAKLVSSLKKCKYASTNTISNILSEKLKGNLLIPFAGSGSECVVAKKLGIPFLATEINPEYVKFAKSWLKKT